MRIRCLVTFGLRLVTSERRGQLALAFLPFQTARQNVNANLPSVEFACWKLCLGRRSLLVEPVEFREIIRSAKPCVKEVSEKQYRPTTAGGGNQTKQRSPDQEQGEIVNPVRAPARPTAVKLVIGRFGYGLSLRLRLHSAGRWHKASHGQGSHSAAGGGRVRSGLHSHSLGLTMRGKSNRCR